MQSLVSQKNMLVMLVMLVFFVTLHPKTRFKTLYYAKKHS